MLQGNHSYSKSSHPVESIVFTQGDRGKEPGVPTVILAAIHQLSVRTRA